MRIWSTQWMLCVLISLLVSCATFSLRDSTGVSVELTEESYIKMHSTKGIVLLDVNWGRRWNCGLYENAELRRISFDRIPPMKPSDALAADVILEQPPRLATSSTFISYALLLEPGEYALSGFNIKFAQSVSNIGYWIAKRSDFIRNGETLGGTFKVAAGETVYIGNFFLDCYKHPQLWRYYTESENFQAHLAEYKRKYPFLNVEQVTYRLFETNTLGRPYSLK